MKTYLISSPLSIPVSSRKNFSLNLNQYRNAHYQTLNKAKRNYSDLMALKLLSMNIDSSMEKIFIVYKLYVGSKRRLDVHNVCSIVDKFFSDVLVEEGYIEDDDYDHAIGSLYLYGGLDRENPRVDIYINVLKEKDMKFTISEDKLREFVQSQVEELVTIKDDVELKMDYLDGVINVELVKAETKSKAKKKEDVPAKKVETKKPEAEEEQKEETKKEDLPFDPDEDIVMEDPKKEETKIEQTKEEVIENKKEETKSTSLFANLSRDKEPVKETDNEVKEDKKEEPVKAKPSSSIFG